MSSCSRLEELFKRCDSHGTGLIGPQEFRELCLPLGIALQDSDVIFADLDHDGDGQINFDDFSYGFRDFLTPGSRRGSLQIPLQHQQHLAQMEMKHATAKPAWKQFSTSLGITEATWEGKEDDDLEAGDGGMTEKALRLLMTDVERLREEYKSLESSFRKEREFHAAQLAALGEELDHQLAKTEAKAKAEAREEAHKEIMVERTKISAEMEAQLSELSTQLTSLNKVEGWMSEKETVKLSEANIENQTLKSALLEAQMKATLLQTQLTQRKHEYFDLHHQLNTEKATASEYRNQVGVMQSHLSILSEANRVLSDVNDTLFVEDILDTVNRKTPSETDYGFSGSEKGDSGRGTLLEELRAEGDTSPLPSGLWSSPSPKSLPPVLTEPERTFKVILAGDAAVGKSTFIERVCHGHFKPNLSSTIGVDFRVKTVELDDKPVALQLWDTAGQERFRSLTKSYFRRADGVILMYDVTNEKTFLSIRHWVDSVQEGAVRRVPIILCANKVDLRGTISAQEGLRLSTQCGAIFLETSPKTGFNVKEALILLAREMSLLEDAELESSVRLEESEEEPKKRACCNK